MKLVVLGWGSLIWNPKRNSATLKLACNDWFSDGPELPIEFARISNDGRLTLVLFPGVKKIQVLWALMDSNNLDEGVKNLRDVEGTCSDNIGFVDLHTGQQRSRSEDIACEIREWANIMNVDAVIWTDLPPKFTTNVEFTNENVISYLKSLTDGAEKKAEEYVRKAPAQIRTNLRSVIEEKLGWFPEINT